MAYRNEGYQVVMLLLWLLVGGAALFDYCFRSGRGAAPKGWQLHRAVSIVLASILLEQIVTTIWALPDEV